MHHGYMFPKYGDKDTGSFVYHINMENFCKDFHDILNLDLIQVSIPQKIRDPWWNV